MSHQIKLIGGPLNGVVHELHGGLVPFAISLKGFDADTGNALTADELRQHHWYQVSDDEETATFIRSEVRDEPR